MQQGRLRLLAGFTFESAGQPVIMPLGQQRLLAFLALRGPSHRSLVAGTLWPEAPEEHSLASLRTSVWRLNRLVPELLEIRGSALALTETTTVDSNEQELLAIRLLHEHADPAREAAALRSLWPSGLLPGWYDDWVVVERERLSQLRLHALERTAGLLLAEGDLALALQVALEVVHTAPLRETANAALISVYLAEGNISDAIRQYDAYCMLLERELGLQPSARLTDLLLTRTR